MEAAFLLENSDITDDSDQHSSSSGIPDEMRDSDDV